MVLEMKLFAKLRNNQMLWIGTERKKKITV